MLGFRKYESLFRGKLCDSAFIPDDGAIPKGRKFKPQYPCHVVHPDVCMSSWPAAAWALLKRCSDTLQHLFLADKSLAGFFRLEVHNAADLTLEVYMFLCYRRWNHPKLAVVCACDTEESEDGPVLAFRMIGSVPQFMVCERVVDWVMRRPGFQDVNVCTIKRLSVANLNHCIDKVLLLEDDGAGRNPIRNQNNIQRPHQSKQI